MSELKPSRCVDPIIKHCQECRWGYVHYPEWVETYADLEGCCFESGCTLGFDKGRPEDEPTEEEWNAFEAWYCRREAYRETTPDSKKLEMRESERSCENCGNTPCANSHYAYNWDECVSSDFTKHWTPKPEAQHE